MYIVLNVGLIQHNALTTNNILVARRIRTSSIIASNYPTSISIHNPDRGIHNSSIFVHKVSNRNFEASFVIFNDSL